MEGHLQILDMPTLQIDTKMHSIFMICNVICAYLG